MRFGYFNLFNGMNFPLPYPRQLIGVAGAKMEQGRPLVVRRPTGEVNQAWSMNLGPYDSAGHACYWFGDAASPSVPMVMGVAAGNTSAGSAVIIWPLTLDSSNNYGNSTRSKLVPILIAQASTFRSRSQIALRATPGVPRRLAPSTLLERRPTTSRTSSSLPRP